MRGFAISAALCLWLSNSCTRMQVAPEAPTSSSVTIQNSGYYLLKGKLKSHRPEIIASVTTLSFKSPQEAMNFAIERRHMLLRHFDTLVEPYYGTANETNCENRLKSSLLTKSPHGIATVLHLLSAGPSHAIHDCQPQNNTDWAHIEFITCGNEFYDIRFYKSLRESAIPYEQIFYCGGSPWECFYSYFFQFLVPLWDNQTFGKGSPTNPIVSSSTVTFMIFKEKFSDRTPASNACLNQMALSWATTTERRFSLNSIKIFASSGHSPYMLTIR